ncbi:MAG: hypothetical protein ACKO0V_25025 [bacterium]
MGKTLHWDEVDYVLAARQGVVANATDSSAFSALDFLRFVIAKFKNQPLSEFPDYDEDHDVFNLRHSHPPLLHFVLAMLWPERLNPGHETELRLLQFSGAALLIATMLWGYLKISENPTLPGLAAVSAVGVLCGFFLGRDLNCHLWIAVSLIFTSLSVGQFLARPVRRNGIADGSFIGLNFLGLQTGVFVAFWAVIAVGIAILLSPEKMSENNQKLNFRKMFTTWVIRSVWMLIGFIALVLVAYPGAFLRLSLLRIFALYAFLIIKGNEYSGVSSRYSGYISLVFPLLILGVTGLVRLVFQNRSPRWYLALATSVIGFGYGLILLKFLLNITYITPALALFGVLGMAAISSWKKPVVDMSVAIGLMAFTVFRMTTYPASSNHYTIQNFQQLADILGSRQALIEGGHILKYYEPQVAADVVSVTVSGDQKTLIRRDTRKLQYNPVTPEQLAGNIVILRTFINMPQYEWEKHLPANVRKLQVAGIEGAIYEFPTVSPNPSKADSASPDHSQSPLNP